jgi:anaphase-promoting complex subunit 10
VQVAVLANHQNGRDTHIRQILLYGPSGAAQASSSCGAAAAAAAAGQHLQTLESSMFATLR